MNHILTLELTDQVFTAIQQQAELMGVAPEHLATTLLQERFGQGLKRLSEVEEETARLKFEGHFGTLVLEQPTNFDNESIDADIAIEYAGTHEVE